MVMVEAIGSSGSASSGSVGLVFLGLAAGLAAGAHFGGVAGAGVGTILGGAAVNILRAASNVRKGTPEADREARVSLLYGTAAAVAGGVAWVKFVKPRQMRPNPEPTGPTVYVIGADEVDMSSPSVLGPENLERLLGSSCDIRPVGPSR